MPIINLPGDFSHNKTQLTRIGIFVFMFCFVIVMGDLYIAILHLILKIMRNITKNNVGTQRSHLSNQFHVLALFLGSLNGQYFLNYMSEFDQSQD